MTRDIRHPRGCSCAYHRRRRAANTRHAAARRAVELAKVRLRSAACPRRAGQHPCGGRLETDTDHLGRTVVRCAWCERRERGICRDCTAPVDGRVGSALRCKEHKRAANLASRRRHGERNAETIRAAQRARLKDPEVRERALEYKRAWRRANREKVRAQKRRYMLRQPKKAYAYHRRYRKKFHEHVVEQRTLRYYANRPERPTPACRKCGASIDWWPLPGFPIGHPPSLCDDCCWPYELRKREERRVRSALIVANEMMAPAAKQKPIRRPANRKLAPTGERLCLGEKCTMVMHGRAKKCDRCKEIEREAVIGAIGYVPGVGRQGQRRAS